MGSKHNHGGGVSGRGAVVAGGLLLLAGCCTTPSVNTMNEQWKQALGQLQITPIMPLRQEVRLGSVYPYLKKPPAFYEDGQVEPPVAFHIPFDGCRAQRMVVQFPEVVIDTSVGGTLGLPIEGFGTLSSVASDKRKITVRVTEGYSVAIPTSELLKGVIIPGRRGPLTTNQYLMLHWANGQPCTNTQTVISGSVHNLAGGALQANLPSYSHQPWWACGKIYDRSVVWLRIPVEVFYAKKLTASVSVDRHFTNTLQGDLDVLKTNMPELKLGLTGTNLVSVTELEKPMAIGYRGVLLKVWIHGEPAGKVEEYLEGQ